MAIADHAEPAPERLHALDAARLLHRQIGLLGFLEQCWLPNLTLAIILITACLAIASVPPPKLDAIQLAGAICYALAIWTRTFAVIGLALRSLSGFGATRRHIADAVLALSDPNPDRNGAAGWGLRPRLAAASQICNHSGDRLRADIRRLSALGAPQFHRRSAEWRPRAAHRKQPEPVRSRRGATFCVARGRIARAKEPRIV
jgi:hypothetical protein